MIFIRKREIFKWTEEMVRVHDFTLPKLGQGDSGIEIMDFKVKIGDQVKKGDPIVEVETEKASTVLESEINGVVTEVLIKNGEVVQVGTVLCRIKEDQ